jgi:hypothetical protein
LHRLPEFEPPQGWQPLATDRSLIVPLEERTKEFDIDGLQLPSRPSGVLERESAWYKSDLVHAAE